jgi:hypothetical protein
MRVVNSVRQNGTTVNVIAAGVFPSFAAGIWRSPLQVHAAEGAVIVLTPDTLDFGFVPAGETGELLMTLENVGDEALFLTTLTTDLSLFSTDWESSLQLLPDSSVSVRVFFSPDTTGEYQARLLVQNIEGQDIQVPLYGSSDIVPVDPAGAALPAAVSLAVWPNPGNSAFRIRYELPAAQEISLRVFDVTGRLVQAIETGRREVGAHVVSWEGSAYASGLYFVRLETAAGPRLTKKLLLVK